MQGRKVEDLEYGTLDAVGQSQRAKRGGVINGVEQEQGAAGFSLGDLQNGGGVDASNIIQDLKDGQQGRVENANAALSEQQQRQGQGQGSAVADLSELLSGQNRQQDGPTGIDVNGLLNDLAQGQQGGLRQGVNGVGAGDAEAIVKDLLGGGRSSDLGAILDGLNGQRGKGQGNGLEIIQIKESIVQQINGGGAAKATVIESAAAASSTEDTTVRLSQACFEMY